MEESSNFFAVFDLPLRFQLDEQQLKKRFYELQRSIHPDRRQRGEKDSATDHSALLNLAYQTLKEPFLRARHLLMQQAAEVLEQNEQDPAFLLEQLELRESIAQSTASQRQLLAASLEQQWQQLWQQFERCCDAQQDYAAAAHALHRLQFLQQARKAVDGAA